MTGIYTFIVNYRSGTYISRVNASNVLTATHDWAEQLIKKEEVAHLDTAAFRGVFQHEIEEYPPTPINENPNVWCLSYFYGRNRMEVHIVKTDREAAQEAQPGNTAAAFHLLAN